MKLTFRQGIARHRDVITFKQFLTERARTPVHLGYVKSKLKELRPVLWEKDLTTDQILDALNDAFGKLLVRFDVHGVYRESNYGRAGLGGAEYSHTGWITIHLLDDIDLTLDGRTHAQYEDFSSLCAASIAHELTHRDQVLKHDGNIDNPKDPDRLRDYLADHREMESFAVQAALEMLASFDGVEILKKLSSSKGIEELSKYSDSLEMYLSVFNMPSSIMNKFLKKLHAVLTEDE